MKWLDAKLNDAAEVVLQFIGKAAYKSNKQSILRSKNPKTKLNAVVSLGHIHEIARLGSQIEEALIPALQDEDSRVRSQAALSLAWNGYIKHSIPFLQVALKDKEGSVRYTAIYALRGQRDLLPEITSMADDSDKKVREAVVRVIGLSSEGKDYIPLLLKAAQDEAVNVRREAIDSLAEVGTSAIIPFLEKVIETDHAPAWQGVKGKEDYQHITLGDFASSAIRKIEERENKQA